MPQLTASISKYPARVSLGLYACLVAAGTAALCSPLASASRERPISVLDAAFTATSAACVTGLSVVSTEHDFSIFGQAVILALIQVGGVGIMTVTTFFMLRLGARVNLRARAVISETLGADEHSNLNWILGHVIRFTLLFEACGFLLLWGRDLWGSDFEDPWRAIAGSAWRALFHAVSAFNNAGFSILHENLVAYRDDLAYNATIGALIVMGGIGYPVMIDLRRHWRKEWREFWVDLTLHTKLMLIGTAALLTLGTVAFLLLEWNHTLAEVPLGKRCVVALFHAISCRTAGFNTVDVGALTDATLFVSIMLMAIGAGPCSTAGGFKVSTVMVLLCDAWSTFRGQSHLNVFRRTVPHSTVERATATAMLFMVLALAAVTLMLVFQGNGSATRTGQSRIFLDTLFEVVSALGTVGLSTGITPGLPGLGKLILILLMFLGRLGPISVFVALSLSKRRDVIEFANEEPIIG
jgi:trk system potassium uptake protein TrkH